MGILKQWLKKMEESRVKQVTFFCVSMLLLIAAYSFGMHFLNRQFVVVDDNFSWVYQIDAMEKKGDKLQIIGWAFALNQNAEAENVEIVLRDTKTGKNIYPMMSYESREDVNNYFLCEYDYSESGFTAIIDAKKMQNTVYEVLLRPSKKKTAYSTGVFYSDGKMRFVHPDEYASLVVTGTDLEKVVENGILRVYRPEHGVYVYQYEGDLYWVMEPQYSFVDGDTYVQFQMNTTQVRNLPSDRLENGYNWSNLGFMFSSNELTTWNTGMYRVTKAELPKDYSVTNIWTGNHIDEWIWQQSFRPWYEFD